MLADSLADTAFTFGLESPSYVAIRSVMYLSALCVIGACAFVLLIATRVSHLSGDGLRVSTVAPAARRVALAAAFVLALAMTARMLAQAYLVGEGQFGSIAPMLRSTVWGWGWLLGAVATLLVAAALAAARASRLAWRLTALGTGALALSFSLTGHAVSVQGDPALHVALDTIHVMAAGGWLGSLFVVMIVGLPAALSLPTDVRARATAQLINAFSSLALVCVATLALTGIVAAWTQLPTVPSLWQTQYGLALVRKLVVLGFAGLVGVYNWRVIRPQLEHAGTVKLLRRSATAELTLGVVVVILTAVLVATSPPDMDDMPMSSSRAPATHRVRAGASLLAPAAAPTFRHTNSQGSSMTAPAVTMPPVAGDLAPDFTADSTSGQPVTLSLFRGKKRVLLAFFPLAFTSTCTSELCDFSADFDQFSSRDVEVLPISVDSVPTLREFKTRHSMRVDLLSDFRRDISRAYGVLLADKFFSARAYFLVGLNGTIEWAHVEANPGQKRSNVEILEQIAAVPA